MPQYQRVTVLAFCLVTTSCQSQRSVLHHGSAKANYLTPTAGSVMVQTPSMLPAGMARATNPTWTQPTTPASPGAGYASTVNPAPAQPAIAAQPVAPISPSSNASAAAPTETVRSSASADPYENRASTPEKYQPAYPPLTEPQAETRNSSAQPFDAPIAAPSRSGSPVGELPLPVAASDNKAVGSGDQAVPFVPPTQTSAGAGAQRTNSSGRTSSSLIEELRPPR